MCYDKSMKELFTRAWVLERTPLSEADEQVLLYTEEFGTIKARAKSIRKITSKVSSQLQPLSFSRVRLIRRNGNEGRYAILDALRDDTLPRFRPEESAHLLPIAQLIASMAYEWEVDGELWKYLEDIVRNPKPLKHMQRDILAFLGFDAEHASCMVCGSKPVKAFYARRHEFVCESCASKMPQSEILLI